MINFEQSTIERGVMRRVHIARVLRVVISTDAFAILIFVLALWGISREVWVARIFQNTPDVASETISPVQPATRPQPTPCH